MYLWPTSRDVDKRDGHDYTVNAIYISVSPRSEEINLDAFPGLVGLNTRGKVTIFLCHTFIFLARVVHNNLANERFHATEVKMCRYCLVCTVDTRMTEYFMIPDDYTVNKSKQDDDFILVEYKVVFMDLLDGVTG